MVSIIVKMNKILTFLILAIVSFSVVLLVMFSLKAKNNIDPEQYLKSFGYEIELIGEKQVNIPKNFSDGLKEYNKLQKSQGFNLQKYKGKECIQKQYYVTSKKISPEKYIANLITYKNKLIGGDLHSKYYKQQPLKLNSIK